MHGRAGQALCPAASGAGSRPELPQEAMKRLGIDRDALAMSLFGLAATALAAVTGGLLWQRWHWPLPWIAGALAGSAMLAMTGFPVRCPPLFFMLAQWLIGTAVGAHFTSSAAAHLTLNLGSMLVVAIASLWLGWVLAPMLRRWAHLDGATALLASLPGMSGEMVRLAAEHGARADHVAVVQTVRLSLVVLLVPPAFQWFQPGAPLALPAPVPHGIGEQAGLLLAALAGAACLRRLLGGVGWFLGSLLGAAGATAAGLPVAAPPALLTDAAQLFLGWSLGSRFTPRSLLTLPRLLPVAIVLNVAAICGGAGLAWALARRSDLSPASAMLGAIPGGIAEMSITAVSMGEPVALVAGFHVVRVVVLLLLAGPLLKVSARDGSRPGPST